MKVLRKVLTAGMMAALVFVVTWLIHIPVPGTAQAYLNPGDAIVYISAFVPGGLYAAVAVGLGSALADIASGAVVYALPTFIIKFLMALICWLIIRKHRKSLPRFAIGSALGGLIMMGGYMLTEVILYGAPMAAVGLVANIIQFAFGVIAGLLLYIALRRVPESVLEG